MANYQILLDGTPYDPTNFGDVVISYEPFRDFGAYFFRKKLGGDLTFQKAAYLYVLSQINIGQCERITVEIQQRCNGAWVSILEGYFHRQSCTVNYDNCFIEVEVETTDEYSCILDNADIAVNILATGALAPNDFAYFPTFGLQFLAVPTVAIACAPETNWGAAYTIAPYTTALGNTYCLYFRYVVRVRCVAGLPQEPPPALTAWTLLSNDCAIDGTATYWRNVQPTEILFTFTDYNCLMPCTPAPCTSSLNSGVFVVGLNAERICAEPLQTQFFLTNTRELVPAINYILDEICGTGIVVESALLTDAINPVTGLDNPLQDMFIMQKSDAVNPTATEWATVGDLAIKDVLGDITALVNGLWYVDSVTNKLILEHVTGILSNTIGIDLTTLEGGIWDVGTNVISWDKEQVPRTETFTYPIAAQSIDFAGLPIEYTEGCTDAPSIETRTQRIETEISRIFQNSNEGLEGFILFCINSINETDSLAENGELSQLFIPNAPLSWANLHRDYFQDYRYLLEGTLNGVPTTFNSTRPIKRQENLVFPVCCLTDFNPLELIKTSQGDGRLEAAEYDLASGKMTVTIKFEDN